MKSPGKSTFLTRGFATAALIPILACPPLMSAQTTGNDVHLVPPSQLQQQMQSSTQTRQQEIKTLNDFLSMPGADKAMRDANIDPNQVRTAVPTLTDAQLANLSARANHAQQQFAAGAFGLHTILLIVVIIAVIIIIAALV